MIYIAILGHLVSDFALQDDSMIKRKKNSALLGNAIHSSSVAGITAAMFFGFYLWNNLLSETALIDCAKIFGYIFATHLVIDIIKYNINKESLLVDVIDQALHITAIFLLFKFIPVTQIPIPQAIALLLRMLIVIVFCIWVGDIFIRQTLGNHEGKRESHKENINHTGSTIGRIERFIMLVFMLLGYQLGIITVFAIKSIIRFQEYKKGDNDYYIFGNLLSLLVVIISYCLWLGLSYGFFHSGGSVMQVFNTSIK